MSFRTKLTLVLVGIIGIALLVSFIFYKQEFNVSKFSTYCGLLSFIPLLLFVQFTNAKSRKFPLLVLFLLMMFPAVGWWAFVKAFQQIGPNGWGYSVVWALSALITGIGLAMFGSGKFRKFGSGDGSGGGEGEHVGDIYQKDKDKFEIRMKEKL